MPEEVLSFEEWLMDKYGLDYEYEVSRRLVPTETIRVWYLHYERYLKGKNAQK